MEQPLNIQDAIFNLQTYLRALSFVDDRIERVPIDGIFDTDTEKAVASFQRTRGLPETAIVDKQTWDAIYNEYKNLQKRSPYATPNFFPQYPENYEATKGERHSFIALVQLLLRELTVVYDTLPFLEVDGIFGEKTEATIKEFQRISLLPVTGRVDIRTWDRLSRDFANYAGF